jgi:cytochrome b subunit of formate dehydrogenase
MANKKAKNWIVNIISFILFVVLAVTGLINWLLLPHGPKAGGILSATRHLLIDIHEWAALFFIIVITVHLLVHWKYIKAMMKN